MDSLYRGDKTNRCCRLQINNHPSTPPNQLSLLLYNNPRLISLWDECVRMTIPLHTQVVCKAWKNYIMKLFKRDGTDYFSATMIDGWSFVLKVNYRDEILNKNGCAVLCKITGLHQRIILPFSPHVHIIPGYGFSYCSNTVSDLSHFTTLNAGEWLSKPMLSETTEMFMLCKCALERLVEHHYIKFTATLTR